MSDLPRLMHHFEPKKGWINDPNGLCFFGGKYHAFFQHYPFEAKWGPMHWGHAVSEDLVNWEELPIALYPDMPYENGGGCFSGSALEKDGVLYLMYTSVSKEHGQTQSIAVSRDGLDFEKLPENPVIPQSPLDPENHDFRDPKIFPYGDGYRMVCGAGQGGMGYVLLFCSPDLLHWEYAGKLFESDQFGAVPECPDFFPLGDKWVLLFSRMDTRSAQFIVGEFDGIHFTPESYQQPECGTDFYAPQTFLDGKGRRLMIGWLYNWDRKVPEGASYAGALSVPTELTLRDGKVFHYPAEETQSLLRGEDEHLLRQDGVLKVTNGERILLERPLSQVSDAAVLRDTKTCEVFLNHGEQSGTFYFI